MEHKERHLRTASIIDQAKLNGRPVAVVGCGAIGSHLAKMLAQMGVSRIDLVDFDLVDATNLGSQGFAEADLDKPKTQAVSETIKKLDSRIEVNAHNGRWERGMFKGDYAIFACVDCMTIRKHIFNDWVRSKDMQFFVDGRMAAESLVVYAVDKENPESIEHWRKNWFPNSEAIHSGCTAKSTIYCASMAAATMAALYKQWVMGQIVKEEVVFNLLAMECA